MAAGAWLTYVVYLSGDSRQTIATMPEIPMHRGVYLSGDSRQTIAYGALCYADWPVYLSGDSRQTIAPTCERPTCPQCTSAAIPGKP